MSDTLSEVKKLTEGMEVIEPFVLADTLVKAGLVTEDKKAEVASIVLTTPTSMFLYDGVKLLVQKILHAGSHIVIWTQGDPATQNAKASTSGLLQLAKDTHGHIEIAADQDKIHALEGLLKRSIEGKKRILIVDDKSSQLLRTYQAVIKVKEVDHSAVPTDTAYIWARRDPKTNTILPDGFKDMEQLSHFMENKLSSLADIENLPAYAHTLYLIDFDRTLFDTDKWFKTVQERIATEACLPA